MPLKVRDIYQYVFEKRAFVDTRNVPENKRSAAIDKKNSITKAAFASIVKDKEISDTFRSMLKTVGATELDKVLYGDAQFIEKMPYYFPNTDEIKDQFAAFNKKYHYFTDCDDKAFLAFKRYFNGLKLYADFIEKNNDRNNKLAFEHAYKALVLFGINKKSGSYVFYEMDKYLLAQKYYQTPQRIHPIQDALERDIPINDPPLNMAQWRKFIKKYGAKALGIFQVAPIIEKLAGKVPTTLEEAEQAYAKHQYANYNDYPELANLCITRSSSFFIFPILKRYANLANILSCSAGCSLKNH